MDHFSGIRSRWSLAIFEPFLSDEVLPQSLSAILIGQGLTKRLHLP